MGGGHHIQAYYLRKTYDRPDEEIENAMTQAYYLRKTYDRPDEEIENAMTISNFWRGHL
jgi:hypothetical protein